DGQAVDLQPGPSPCHFPGRRMFPGGRPDGTKRGIVRRTAVVGAAVIALAGWALLRTPRRPAGPSPDRIVIGVAPVEVRGGVAEWMVRLTRASLTTLLVRLADAPVYSDEYIKSRADEAHETATTVAGRLGITRMVFATLRRTGGGFALEVRAVRPDGVIVASQRTEGPADRMMELQNQAVVSLLRALDVPIDAGAL